jgi:hypothetical protein
VSRQSLRLLMAMVVGTALALAGCSPQAPSSQDATTDSASASAGASMVGSDQDITFTAGQVTVHGSLRMPPHASAPVPAAVLLAGSGPTDRNGNTPALPGSIDTLRSLADVLATDGVASVRYDKLSTGATGLGPFASDPSSIGYTISSTRPAQPWVSWPDGPTSMPAI